MRAGNFDLILLEQVQPVGPVLHHDAALLDVLGVVVGRADPIRIGMRKLGVYPLGRIPQFIERSRDGGANAMPSELVFIAHTLERAIERVLAQRVFQAPITGDEIHLCWLQISQQMTNDLLCLQRQWHDVWRDVGETLALLLGELLALLEPDNRDDPQTALQIKLIGRGVAQFTGAHAREQQQT